MKKQSQKRRVQFMPEQDLATLQNNSSSLLPANFDERDESTATEDVKCKALHVEPPQKKQKKKKKSMLRRKTLDPSELLIKDLVINAGDPVPHPPEERQMSAPFKWEDFFGQEGRLKHGL